MSGVPSANVVASVSGQARFVAPIFVGGLVVGVLDLAYAILVYSPAKPILIPQTIAAGVLGARSYEGGPKTAVLGVILHFVIAIVAASVYHFSSRKIVFLTNHESSLASHTVLSFISLCT